MLHPDTMGVSAQLATPPVLDRPIFFPLLEPALDPDPANSIQFLRAFRPAHARMSKQFKVRADGSIELARAYDLASSFVVCAPVPFSDVDCAFRILTSAAQDPSLLLIFDTPDLTSNEAAAQWRRDGFVPRQKLFFKRTPRRLFAIDIDVGEKELVWIRAEGLDIFADPEIAVPAGWSRSFAPTSCAIRV